jgi:hypothetical protein
MKTPEAKLSGKKARALSCLLSARGFCEAAKTAGVSEPTLWRWMKEEPFRLAYAEARRQVVEVALAHLQAVCGKAVSTLEDILDDGEASASSKVSAARVILETSVKIIELQDLEGRIEALEKRLDQRGR